MCGISGLICRSGFVTDVVERFEKSCRLMNHRGPDHTGVMRDEKVFLLHHRLSIIDLDPRSNQPFESACKRYWSVYNGELYNYHEIAQSLKINMRTDSDTEVMVESFARKGSAIIPDWNGIFAVAILDSLEGKLHLIRDRFGVKPLYWLQSENFFAFASEAKVLLDWLPSFEIESRALAQYLWFGNTTGEQTMVKGIRKLMPGEHMRIDVESARVEKKQQFWSPYTSPTRVDMGFKEAVAMVRVRLEKAVTRQLMADVPLGVLLSGGVDSSAIVAMAAAHSAHPLTTYSAAYDYNIGGRSEFDKARAVANRYNTDHHEIEVRYDHIPELFENLVFQYDEPFADAAAIPLYQLARLCAKDLKVVIQGDGGDEVFGGYRRYAVLQHRTFWHHAAKLHPLLPRQRWRQRMRRIELVLGQDSRAATMAYYLTEDVPYHSPYRVLTREAEWKCAQVDWQEDYKTASEIFQTGSLADDMLRTDMRILLPHTYLEKVDKATMAFSLEARVPFLDNDLVALATSLPIEFKVRSGSFKRVLRKAIEDMVPKEVLNAPKRGFDVPYREWLRGPLFEFAQACFSSLGDNLMDGRACQAILAGHRDGDVDQGSLLWKALVLGTWARRYAGKIRGLV